MVSLDDPDQPGQEAALMVAALAQSPVHEQVAVDRRGLHQVQVSGTLHHDPSHLVSGEGRLTVPVVRVY